MTRDEYNEAHRKLEREHRIAHRANTKAHARPKKFAYVNGPDGERRVRSYAFLAWVRTPAAEAWAIERARIFAHFRTAHIALKKQHPEFNQGGAHAGTLEEARSPLPTLP